MLDRLRDRILLGRYFGCWVPGDRLPSVREIARLEDVDRKTAAAAYRRLQREGLVDVEPRSGVYLKAESGEEPGDPLSRLHRQWLEHTLTSAAELGLSSSTVTRMLHAVSAVEGHRIPVVDEDAEHAALMARELEERTGLECAAARASQLPAHAGPLKDAPFVVATPSVSARLRLLKRHMPMVRATLAPALFDDLRKKAQTGDVVVIVGTVGLARELERAVDHGLVGPPGRVRVVRPRGVAELDQLGASDAQLVLWPGVPGWALERLNGNGDGRSATDRLMADETLKEIRHQVARAALEHVSRSNGAVPRAALVG